MLDGGVSGPVSGKHILSVHEQMNVSSVRGASRWL